MICQVVFQLEFNLLWAKHLLSRPSQFSLANFLCFIASFEGRSLPNAHIFPYVLGQVVSFLLSFQKIETPLFGMNALRSQEAHYSLSSVIFLWWHRVQKEHCGSKHELWSMLSTLWYNTGTVRVVNGLSPVVILAWEVVSSSSWGVHNHN